jgi:hypothetical protein
VVCAVFDARRVVRLVAVNHCMSVCRRRVRWQHLPYSLVRSGVAFGTRFRPFDKMALLVRPRAQASMVLGTTGECWTDARGAVLCDHLPSCSDSGW